MKKFRETGFLREVGSYEFLLKMKLLIIFLMLGILQSTASVYSQQQKLALQFENATLVDVFEEIEQNSEFTFLYSNEDVESVKGINLRVANATVDQILDACFTGTALTYTVNDRLVIIKQADSPVLIKDKVKSELETEQQKKEIKGKVTDQSGDPLPGVNVVVKGASNIGTITDFEGNYSIEVPTDAEALEYSFIGMVPQTIVIGNSSVINVTLESSTESLDEVVVTALGIQRKVKALGFSAQQIGEDNLSEAREVNVSNFLTGKIAGVQVSGSAAGTGGSTTVTIRGNSSLTGNNQPLYVVDGIPIDNQGHDSGGLSGGNDYGDGIGNINSEDVESISVLKGPNASYLYGSRGANGVILITTKSGKARKGIGVEFNSSTSIEKINLTPKVQNKYGTGYEGTNLYGKMVEINGKSYETLPAWHGDNWGPPLDGRRVVVDPFVFPGEEPRTLTLLPQDPNNIRDFWETGLIANNFVAFTGGDEKTSARLSFGNTNIKGITPKNKGVRNTINLRASSKLTNKLSFDGKVNYTNTKYENRPNLGETSDNYVYSLSVMGRYVPLDFLKKYYEKTGDYGRWPGIKYNPYYVLNELKNNDQRDRIIGFASLRYEFTDWLNLTARSGLDWYSEERQKTWPVGAKGRANQKGRLVETSRKVKESNSDFLLTASGDISSNFSGSFSFGGSLLKQYTTEMSWDARDFKAEGVYHVSNAQDIRPENYLWEKEIQSLYFMSQLAYKNYLFVDISGRNDWSSTLGRNNYSFFYPSVSTSFVFTDAFEMNSNILSFGKLRASWAQVGNDSDPYLTKIGYRSYTTNYNGHGYADVSTRLPAVNLKNELTESWEVGADLRFFKNRLSIDLTYYDGATKNQILPVQVSSSSGYQTVVINAGEIKNSGLEMVLNAGIIRSGSGFKWDLSFNYAKNESKVVELAPGIETYLLVDSYPNIIEARPGQRFGNIIGYKYKRAPDGRRIVGSKGSYLKETDKSILGNITPDWIGGLNNSFSYKGFFMNFLIDFVQGGQLTSTTKYQMIRKGSALITEEGRRPRDTDDQGNQLPYVGVLDGVVEITDANGNVTGYEENTQAVDGQTYWATRGWQRIGEEFVLDASYIMLRELIFGYNFKPNVLKKTPFKGVRVSVVGRNLFYLEEHMQDMGISPESAPNTSAGARGVEVLSMPTTRTFGVNVNLTF